MAAPDPHRYAVLQNGRPHSVWVYARDAHEYVNSEAARDWISLREGDPRGERLDVYPVEMYSIVDRQSERRVVGVTGHGHAILETLRKVGEV